MGTLRARKRLEHATLVLRLGCHLAVDAALGVWLSRHGLELVQSPHQASRFTEDATVAPFYKAHKSMMKPFEADLSLGRHPKSCLYSTVKGSSDV